MAERLSIKDMLAAARTGGAVKAAGESAAVEAEMQAEAPAAEVVEVEVAPAPVAVKPAAAPLDRPLTMKEKLAAARGGGAATPAAAAPVAAKVAAPAVEVAVAAAPAAIAPAPTAESLGRPLTMKEKLAAARGDAAPAATAAAARAKPVVAAGAAPAVAAKAVARELPPLDKITDPRDLAEALRRAGAEKDKATKAAAAAKAATAAGATPANAAVAAKASAAKKLESKAIPPKPSKEGTAAAATAPLGHAPASLGRRPFLGMGIGAVIVTGWAAFTAGISGQVLGCVRFMFPNVLAEPPSTIKVGLASDFSPEQVNDRWKAEWGFWMVRSAAYDGEDKIYAIQSVCTHLGCPPNWLSAETKFKCPCHGSGFYISGVNFEGPAPRPLERFKVAVNDAGEIVVDKGQKFQEELKQWSDADSFIVA